MGMISKDRLFLTADQRLVEEGDKDAAFQLVAPGGMIEDADVQRLGLEMKGDKITQKNAPTGAIAVNGGALLDPRGAVKAAVKDRLKADYEGRIDEETDKEMAKLEGKSDDPALASALALNHAGAMSREALRRRGEAKPDADLDKAQEAVEADLKKSSKAGK